MNPYKHNIIFLVDRTSIIQFVPNQRDYVNFMPFKRHLAVFQPSHASVSCSLCHLIYLQKNGLSRSAEILGIFSKCSQPFIREVCWVMCSYCKYRSPALVISNDYERCLFRFCVVINPCHKFIHPPAEVSFHKSSHFESYSLNTSSRHFPHSWLFYMETGWTARGKHHCYKRNWAVDELMRLIHKPLA